MSSSSLSPDLRRKLLVKVISQKTLTAEDIDSVIALTSEKIVSLMDAQSMTFYLAAGNTISFKFVYYSPSLSRNDPEQERKLEKQRDKLLALELPRGTGVVGQVIESGTSVIYPDENGETGTMHDLSEKTGFTVNTMLTVPLSGSRCVGAVQVLNKEPHPGGGDNLFSATDLKTLEEVAEYVGPLTQKLIDPDYVMSDEAIAKYTARFTGEELITDRAALNVEDKLVELAGADLIRRTRIFPVAYLGPNAISALLQNPFDYPSRAAFEEATEMSLDQVYVGSQSLLDELIGIHCGEESPAKHLAEESGDIAGLMDAIGEKYEDLADQVEGEDLVEESAPIVLLANRIIEDAYIQEASDIHIEPQEDDLLVRYRIDGVCKEKMRLPAKTAGPIAARLKVMSGLDIAEKRVPQDGRIVFKRFTKRKIDIDLRIATSPMNFGEKIVMRILDKTKSALPITSLGFSEENLSRYRELIKQPYGMILHCGPTGSGKSMTLFSALREVASPEVNVQTAEDPIEYTIPGINQMQVHKKIGLDFAAALRSYLRMDPDIILVGEIRDRETAEISVEAALTGHLLLSTLHTNDAPSTIARFTDMEIEPFMISASLLVVCAQRLMRRVCPACRVDYTPEGRELDMMRAALGTDWGPELIYRASETGCPKCNNIGMKGRVGIHELMTNSDELTAAINDGKETAELKRIAMRKGMKTLHQDALLKVHEGTSTILEAVATVPPDQI
ncbi:MAG: ATPase, T2SS/T4P/T4SS family [Opitutales bacterium]